MHFLFVFPPSFVLLLVLSLSCPRFCLAGLVLLYVSILDVLLVYFVAAVTRNGHVILRRKMLDGKGENARSALGLSCIIHTLTNTVHTSRTNGETGGQER